MASEDDALVEHPTFIDHIKFFFDDDDAACMKEERGIDLKSYESVKSNASNIYFQVKSGHMPPQEERRWSENRVKTFRNWIIDKHPRGIEPFDAGRFEVAFARADAPVRPNAASLSDDEVKRLAGAFSTLMAREPDDPNSYFALAGIHWFPAPTYCIHNQPQYNPWHRLYIDRFEAGLRTVSGCEDICLPYWDITEEPPAWLFSPPFDSYVLQADASDAYPAGTATKHNSSDFIAQEVANFRISEQIRSALNEPYFENFAVLIENAHNDGHGACGPSMSATDIASFDPLFWFFHCNWERMWWAWQIRFKAGTLEGFRTALATPSDADWLDHEAFNELPPFGARTPATIAIDGYNYETAPISMFADNAENPAGSLAMGRRFSLDRSPRVSLRIKGIERLRIPGSFRATIMADGKPVAERFFFQSTQPEACPNCANQPTVNLDFRLDPSLLAGKTIDVALRLVTPNGTDEEIDPTKVGNPTVNIRELLQGE